MKRSIKNPKRLIALSLAMLMMAATVGCGTDEPEPTPTTESAATAATTASEVPAESADTYNTVDISEEVVLEMFLFGTAPNDETPMQEFNTKLKEKANMTLTINNIPWDAISTKYPLMFASGQSFDLIYVGSGAEVPYATLAQEGGLMPLEDMLPTIAPQTWEKTTPDMWEEATVDGSIYGVPSRYTEYIPLGVIYRGDLLAKYGMTEITNITQLEQYFDNVLANDPTMVPLAAGPGDAENFYRMFLELTKDWIPVHDVDLGPFDLAASLADPSKVFSPVFTEEYVVFAERMKTWSDKGYIPKDVLSRKVEIIAEMKAGRAASVMQHSQGYVGGYTEITKSLPTSDPKHYVFGAEGKKVLKTRTMQNATGISATSENPERALLLIEIIMNDPEMYNLFHYGIEGKNYELNAEGKIKQPEGFDEASDAYGQTGWAFRTDEYEVMRETDYPGRAEINAEFDTYAVKDPFSNFVFDDTNVSNEMTAVTQVNNTIGMQIVFGKVDDPAAAVEDYRQQLEAAGIQKIIDEVNAQLVNYTPVS